MPLYPDNRSDLRSLLADGQLIPASLAAEQVLGHALDPRTVLRWSMHGRDGVRLPTCRGIRRTHLTTVAAFRAWLIATSDTQPTADVDSVLAALSPRLARREGGA